MTGLFGNLQNYKTKSRGFTPLLFHNFFINFLNAFAHRLLAVVTETPTSSAIRSSEALSRIFRFNILRSNSSKIQRFIKFSQAYRSRLLSSISFKVFNLHSDMMSKVNFSTYAVAYFRSND